MSSLCLASIEVYYGSCDSGNAQPLNQGRWAALAADINKASVDSGYCAANYDLVGDGRNFYDYKITCSNSSIIFNTFEPNSHCDPNKVVGTLEGNWAEEGSPTVCKTTVGQNSIRLTRNDAKNLDYYRQAYEAERFLIDHTFRNKAGHCLIRDYEVFVDSDCTIPAKSVEDDILGAIDVANTVATHATNQCGVIGHLFPFGGPFGVVRCDATQFQAANFEDFRCQR